MLYRNSNKKIIFYTQMYAKEILWKFSHSLYYITEFFF